MSARLAWRYLLFTGLAACGGAGTSAPAAPSTGLCDGTPAAGTCFDRFFVPFTACWKGGGPTCTQEQKDVATTVQCWPSGARAEGQVLDLATGKTQITWTQDGATCLNATITQGQDAVTAWTLGGATLSYDFGTGAVTCPDGTTIQFGKAGIAACPALASLLTRGACTNGTCP